MFSTSTRSYWRHYLPFSLSYRRLKCESISKISNRVFSIIHWETPNYIDYLRSFETSVTENVSQVTRIMILMIFEAKVMPIFVITLFRVAVFGSLDMSRSNSMTSSGQCRLAPLIQCIQDSSQLYDYCVKILFKLYAQLPADVLSGHRARFLKQFQQLRQFYIFSSNLQYFKNLIHIPLLPEVSRK